MRRTRLRATVTRSCQSNFGGYTSPTGRRRTEIANRRFAEHEHDDRRQPPRNSLPIGIATSEVLIGSLPEGILLTRGRSPQSTRSRELRNGHPPRTSVKDITISGSFQKTSRLVIPAVGSEGCIYPPVKLTP